MKEMTFNTSNHSNKFESKKEPVRLMPRENVPVKRLQLSEVNNNMLLSSGGIDPQSLIKPTKQFLSTQKSK